MPSGHRFPAIAVGLALAAPAARATQMEHLDTRALVLGSDDILIGEVERVESRWDERRTKILTDVTLRVSRSLKDAAPERLTLTQLGDEVDDVRVTVHAAPVFTLGEEALVFVWRDARGRAQVNGLAQGKFDIGTDPNTGRRIVSRTVPGFAIRDARTLAPVRGRESASRIRLDDLVQEIERALEKEERH